MTVNIPRLRIVLVAAIALFGILRPQGKAIVLGVSQRNVTVDYYPAPHPLEMKSINGSAYASFQDAEISTDGSGSLSGLPVETFFVGLPPDGNPTIEVLSFQSTPKPGIALCRTSNVTVAQGKIPLVKSTYVPVLASAHSNETMSKPTVRISRIFKLRYQRVAVVEISPYDFNPSTDVLTTFSNIRLKIGFPTSSAGSEISDPQFESSYRSLLVNYQQAKQWRFGRILPMAEPPPRPLSIQSGGRYDWFNPGQQYYKARVADDGIYRITYNDVQALGLIPENLDIRHMEVFYKGVSLPLKTSGESDGQFNQGDDIEFFGSRLYDSTGVTNSYSDTSVYWLTFQGHNGPRAEIDSTVAGAPNVVADYFDAVYHVEQDNVYYYGDQGLPNINQTANVPAEGWYWNSVYAGQSLTFQLALDNLYTVGNPSFRLAIKVHSAVYNQSTPNHILDILVNGTPVGTDSLAGYEDKTIVVTGPVSLLTQGNNTITISSRSTSASLNQVLIDWYELRVPHAFRATSDSLLYSSDRISPGLIAKFQIDGFSSPDVSVYRLDSLGGIEKMFTGTITSNSGTYSLTFTDTVVAGSRYYAVSGSRTLAVPEFKPKQFVNLRSPALGADYIIITAPEFLTDANRLASHRAQTGIGRTQVVSVTDIYDEFGFGMFDPTAIRRFLGAADSLWVAPMPSYVLFFGDADWDYKNHMHTDRVNFVPSLGNPVSDELFVAPSTDPFLPTKFIGRIPCSSEAEASTAVDNIINYETMPLSLWNKRYMFMAGGFDSTETLRFSQFCDNLISQYIVPSPVSGLASRIYRTVSQVIQFDQTTESKQILDNGAVWLTYYGHAGTELWGNGITSASQLQNTEGKRHVISDISCSTARFAEPNIDSFAEQLIFADQGGAIAYFGSSGFGFESPLQILSRSLYTHFAIDSVRSLGKLLLGAKINLWSTGTGSVITQEALQQYTLIGDPAMKIAVPKLPDYATNVDNYSSSPLLPNESDSVITISTVLSNFGLEGNDSIEVKIDHRYQGTTETIFDRQLPPIGSLDTLDFTSPLLSKGGVHQITLSIDPNARISEVTRSDNTSEYMLFVNSANILPVTPPSSSSIHPDSVALTVENPGNQQMRSWPLTVEVDTSSTFGGPAPMRIQGIPQGVISTRASIPPGFLNDSTLYYWRGRFVGSADSTNWVGGYFQTNKIFPVPWTQDRPELYAKNVSTGLDIGKTVILDHHRSSVEAYSAGFYDGNSVKITIDNNIITQGFANRGYNVAVVNQFSGKLESFAAFSIYSDAGDTTLSQPLVNFLNAIPSGRRVIMAIWDEGAKGKSESLNEAIEACGSALIRSLSFRASWALIGWKGAPIGSVPEALEPSGSGPVTLYDTLNFQSVSGTMTTPLLGPAHKWNGIKISVDTSQPGTHVSLDVLRSRTDGGIDTLRSIVPGTNALSLLNPSTTAGIQLQANLQSDSLGRTPQLSGWSVNYDAPPELAVNYQTVSLSSDSLFEGAPVTVHTKVYNIGTGLADSVLVLTSLINLSSGRTSIDSAVVPVVGPNSYISIDQQFQTGGHAGTNSVLVQVDPDQSIPEQYKSNNTFALVFTVLSDTAHPTFNISVDGSPVYDGDYVSTNPTIIVDVFDSSPLPITDPTSVVLMMDNQPVTLGTSPDSLFESRSGPDKALVTYRPHLQKGEHTLSVQVKDASGNFADTTARQVTFKVETEPGLLNVYNYPNPFAHQTQFTFNLVGSQLPDNLKIKIYSIAGRLIQELTVWSGDLRIGFNRVPWDGRDRDGDELANGVYFYKIVMSVGGKTQEVIQKLAIVK
jgi:hypothetical protein